MSTDPSTDPARLATIWRQSGWLHRVAIDLGAEPSAADDLVQETLISASRRAPEEVRSLRGWLRKALRRRVSMLRRANERRRVREALAARPESVTGRSVDPLASLEAEELSRVLAGAVARLPQLDREVLALRYAAGLSPAQIAATLGTTPGAVSSRLFRALKALRVRLEHDDRRSCGALLLTLAPMTLMKKTTALCAAAVMLIAALTAGLYLAGARTAEPLEPGPHQVDVGNLAPTAARRANVTSIEVSEAESRAAIPIESDVAAPDPVAAAITPLGGSIHVTVTEMQTGDPAPNVGMHAVRFQNGSYWSQKRALVTDASGRASVAGLTPGRWSVYLDREVAAEERSVLKADVVAGGRSDLAFKVDRDAVIRGRVINELGAPVAGAVVRMTPGGGAVSETFPVAMSGSDGRFLIRYASSMQMVAASAAGYAPSHTTCLALLKAVGRPLEVVLTLRTLRGSIRGQVVDGAGKPLMGAMVTVRSGFGPVRAEEGGVKGDWHGPPQVCTSNADGTFAFADVAVGTATLRARTAASALFSTEVEVAPGIDHEVPVVLRSGGTVRGQVLGADGQVAAGYLVSLASGGMGLMSRVEISTGADGRYELNHLGPGPVPLLLEDDEGHEVATVTLDVPEGSVVTWDPVEVTRPLIHGDLMAEDGSPLVDWYVTSRPNVDSNGTGDRTSAAGQFEIATAIGEVFEVTVFPAGRYFGEPALVLKDYRPDGAALHLVVSSARVPSATVRGRLWGPDGAPTPGTVQFTANEPHTFFDREVGPDGRFEFVYLPQSTFKLTLSAAGSPKREVQVDDPLDKGEDRDLGDLLLGSH